MIVWRIGNETVDYSADDLSGGGAAHTGGRWNDKGQHVVYTSGNASLAMLETAAHTDPAGLPLSRYLVKIEIPDALIALARSHSVAGLPKAWDSVPHGRASVAFGSAWFKAGKDPILVVPSAIVAEDTNTIINVTHPAISGLKAEIVRRVHYDLVFRKHH